MSDVDKDKAKDPSSSHRPLPTPPEVPREQIEVALGAFTRYFLPDPSEISSLVRHFALPTPSSDLLSRAKSLPSLHPSLAISNSSQVYHSPIFRPSSPGPGGEIARYAAQLATREVAAFNRKPRVRQHKPCEVWVTISTSPPPLLHALHSHTGASHALVMYLTPSQHPLILRPYLSEEGGACCYLPLAPEGGYVFRGWMEHSVVRGPAAAEDQERICIACNFFEGSGGGGYRPALA